MDRDAIEGLIVAIVLIAVVAYVTPKVVARNRKRRSELQQWAANHAGTYTAKDLTLTRRWEYFPIRGAGSATDIVRVDLPEGKLTCFTHTLAPGGGSPTSRVVGTLDVGTELPTVVAGSPSVTVGDPCPPHQVRLAAPQLDWSAYAPDAAGAVAAASLLTPQALQRLADDAASLPRLEVVLDGREIMVATFGSLDGPSLKRTVALLRDLSTMLSPAT